MWIMSVSAKIRIVFAALLLVTASGCVPRARQLNNPPSALPATAPLLPNADRVPTPDQAAPFPSLPAEPTPELPPPATDQLPIAADRDRAVASATEDLAQRLGVAPERVVLVSVVVGEFPVDNLGCPALKEPPYTIPGFVMGLEVILAVGEQRYNYHAHGAVLVFCGPSQ